MHKMAVITAVVVVKLVNQKKRKNQINSKKYYKMMLQNKFNKTFHLPLIFRFISAGTKIHLLFLMQCLCPVQQHAKGLQPRETEC